MVAALTRRLRTIAPKRVAAVALCVLAATSPMAQARIVQKVEKDGTVTYANVPDRSAQTGTAPGRPRAPKAARRYLQLLREYARKYRLPVALLRAVLETESAGNHKAESSAGAQGLMQLIPKTQLRMGVADAFDPRENIQGGARYLRELADRFDENIVLIIAGYHAGEAAVERAGYKIPDIPSTRQYVTMVLRRYYRAKAQERAPPKKALAKE